MSHLDPVQTFELSNSQSMAARTSTTKKVHWASEVVDNEDKHRELPRSPVTMQNHSSPHAIPSLRIRLDSSSVSSTRRDAPIRDDRRNRATPVANISKPIGQTRSRSSSDSHSSKRPQSSLSTPRKRDHMTSDGTSSKSKARQSKGSDRKRGHSEHSAANISSKRDSGSRPRPVQIPKFLPAVPEPPQFQRPPPTPRPTRLPTPDLDDLSDHDFCCCDHSFCRGHCGERDDRGLPSSKMDAQSKTMLPKHFVGNC